MDDFVQDTCLAAYDGGPEPSRLTAAGGYHGSTNGPLSTVRISIRHSNPAFHLPNVFAAPSREAGVRRNRRWIAQSCSILFTTCVHTASTLFAGLELTLVLHCNVLGTQRACVFHLALARDRLRIFKQHGRSADHDREMRAGPVWW